MTAPTLDVRGTSGTATRALTVGIVANEFFDPRLGRMGGHGSNALLMARALAGTTELDAGPVSLSGEHYAKRTRPWRPFPTLETRSNGFPLLLRGRRAPWTRRLRSLGIDLLLTIDHRIQYDIILESLPHTPLAVWASDPRAPADLERIATLEIPGDFSPPQGIIPIDSSSMGRIWEQAQVDGRPAAIVSPSPSYLGPKASGAYRIPGLETGFLGNALEPVEPMTRAPRPTVVFLGRLDPIKRPWLFAELARRFPHVEFLMLGSAHFAGNGSGTDWLRRAPENLRLLSHVGGERRNELLSAAWVMVSTSIHEALATCMLEGLHCGVALLSCQDPEGIASRFGVYVGRFDGSGMEALPHYVEGLERLLDDGVLRERLGEEGREWVRTFHTRERFVHDFAALARELIR